MECKRPGVPGTLPVMGDTSPIGLSGSPDRGRHRERRAEACDLVDAHIRPSSGDKPPNWLGTDLADLERPHVEVTIPDERDLQIYLSPVQARAFAAALLRAAATADTTAGNWTSASDGEGHAVSTRPPVRGPGAGLIVRRRSTRIGAGARSGRPRDAIEEGKHIPWQRARSVEDLSDLDPDPSVVAVDDDVPMVVVGHFQNDGADVVEVAVILVLVAVEVSLVVTDAHETDSGSRAT